MIRDILKIPVSCVEQGRWSRVSRSFAAAPHAASPELRNQKKHRTRPRWPLARGASQGEVWDAVRDKASRMGVHSRTGASADAYRAYERELRALEDAFPAQPGQCGALLVIENDMAVDYVSSPDAFARLWPKLRAGYLLDALERLDRVPVSPTAYPTFLEQVDQAERSRQPSAGLGEDLRLRSDRVLGSGLELEGEVIQLSAFWSAVGRHRTGRIARPSRRAS